MRHTLATQAVNRGMSLEAIAALLGHRQLDQALRYAKIANRTVADEYFAVTEKMEALYHPEQPLPANTIGPRMAQLRRDQFRLLGNGYCTRPAELDCAFEAVCENCAYFATGIEFPPHPATPTRRRRRQARHRPPTDLRPAARRTEPGRVMTRRAPRITQPGELPAGRVDEISELVTRDAIEQLARLRTPYWLGDAAVHLHALTSLIMQAQRLLPEAVADARDQEYTWAEIGQLLNLTPQTAARRYRTATHP